MKRHQKEKYPTNDRGLDWHLQNGGTHMVYVPN